MVRRLVLVSLVAVFASALMVATASAQGPTPEQQKQHPQLIFEMTPARIDEAIAYAKREKDPDTFYAIRAGGMYSRQLAVAATTPYLRVVAAASEAKRKYKDFTAADVTPEMIAPELHLFAASVSKGTSIHDVEAIVIMPKGEKDAASAIRPVRTSEIEESYRNLLGAEFQGKGMLAVFPLTMFVNGNEVRVVRRDWYEVPAKFDIKKEFK